MGKVLTAEVTHVTRSIVTVNIDAMLASDWADERANVDSDEDFAKLVLKKIGYHDLVDPCGEDSVGIAIEGEINDCDICYLAVTDE